MRVLGLLYIGCETVWYHCIDGEASRARILHVQGVDSNGVWGDPTIAKLSPKDLLRAEADAHAIFSRYIGESVPQRIGEPVYVDEVGGMVLELVGACWRMPELAHTQATLSNTFSEVIKYDNDHAIEIAAPITARDRPVFGEVRAVIDEVILGQLSQVVRQTAHREPELSLFEYYGLLPKIKKLAERSVREDAGREGTNNASSHFQIVKPSTLAALRSLQDKLTERGDVPDGPPGYPGPWFGLVHGDLHGGNIMVDSRSYAWLIDYGEVEDAHLYKDPAKLEACCWFIYTTLPIPARALQRASAREIRWWLTLPAAVAEVLAERAKQYSNPLTHETLPELLRAACAASGHAGKRVDVDEVMLRFAPEAECEEYLREAEIMISLLMPSADLNLAGQTAMSKGRFDCPPFITKERLRMCWEQVTQIRGLLPQAYTSPSKSDTHPFDAHPMQYATALFHFTYKMATQYREPNPYARRLAAHALERLSNYFLTWLDGGEIDPNTLLQSSTTSGGSVGGLANGAGSNGNTHEGGGSGQPGSFGHSSGMAQLAKEARGGGGNLMMSALRLHSVAYGPGQRLCFAKGEHWREAVVLHPPDSTRANHLLRVFIGTESYEEDVDLDAHPHSALPLYAYAVGCPLRLLSPRGAWEECVIVDRAPLTNQHVVRMPPVGNLHWTLLVPWNHVAMPLHSRVPLFGVRPHDPTSWQPPEDGGSNERSVALSNEALIGEGNEGADLLEKKADDDLDENVATQVELGRTVEFVLNIRAASRSWRSWRALWCPGIVVAVHKKPTRSSALAGAFVSKTCDLAAGGYCFDEAWASAEQPLLIRELVAPVLPATSTSGGGGGAGGGGGSGSEPSPPPPSSPGNTNGDAVGVGGVVAASSPGPDTDDEAEAELELEAELLMESELLMNGDPDSSINGGLGGSSAAASLLQRRLETLAHRVSGAVWSPWERGLVVGDEIEVESEARSGSGSGGQGGGSGGGAVQDHWGPPVRHLRWRGNLRIEIDVQPRYYYLPGTDLRILRGGVEWVTARIISTHSGA